MEFTDNDMAYIRDIGPKTIRRIAARMGTLEGLAYDQALPPCVRGPAYRALSALENVLLEIGEQVIGLAAETAPEKFQKAWADRAQIGPNSGFGWVRKRVPRLYRIGEGHYTNLWRQTLPHEALEVPHGPGQYAARAVALWLYPKYDDCMDGGAANRRLAISLALDAIREAREPAPEPARA